MPAIQPRKPQQQFDFHRYLGILWRRKWLLIIPLAVCVPLALVAAYAYPTEYKSTAILELQDNRPIGDTTPAQVGAGSAIMAVKTRAMSWSAVREIVLSRKVDFGREIDPDDRRQFEKIYSEIERRTQVVPLGGKHISITHTSISPARNAALVNEIVKKFVGADRKEAQERAKSDLKYYRDKFAAAKTALAEIDNQLREFNQQNPWLTETLAEIHKEYKDAETEELVLRQRIKGVEETLAELRKELSKEKPEITRKVRPEPTPEVLENKRKYDQAKARFDQAKAYYEQVSARYTMAHPRCQEARVVFEKEAAAFEQVKGLVMDDPKELEVSEPNPKYAAIQARIAAQEKEIDRLNAQRLDANKKVSELYIRVRKAPELLGERRALEEQRTTAAGTAAEYASGVRVAEKEMQRLLSEAYSARFVVLEYARDDWRPVRSAQAKIIVLGLVLGLLTGAALIGLVEYLDQTFKSIDDARDYLGLPALGVIPAIFTPRDHRRKLWFRVLAISSAVFVVGVAVAIWLTVPAAKEYLNTGWQTFQDWFVEGGW